MFCWSIPQRYSPVRSHQVGHCDVSLTMPEANISLNSNQRNSHIIKPSCDPDVPERNGANRTVRNPVSSNKMSLHDFNNTGKLVIKLIKPTCVLNVLSYWTKHHGNH